MKKKVFLFLSLFSAAASLSAQGIANGYYRFQNCVTERYLTVIDNRASFNTTSTEPDLRALHTYADFDGKIVSDPGSIIYVEHESGGYDLHAQGVSTYGMVQQYVQARESDKYDGAYQAYASKSGVTYYICDPDEGVDNGPVTTNYRPNSHWYVLPVTTEGDNYFGIRPTCEHDGKYYQPFYASFPFSFASEGMKAYYVTKYGNDMAVLEEIKEDVIPGGMPVIIECSTPDPTTNRLNLLTSAGSKPSDNILSGTYFMCTTPAAHRNVVENDATIRMVGVTESGELGLITVDPSEAQYVPANTSYLKVAADAETELRFVDEEEFTSGISEVTVDASTAVKQGVYTLTGVKVADGDKLPADLPSGVYIVGGKKVVVR